MKNIILGAGFTGMAAGIKTGAQIFEATDHAGGICTDYVKDGFRFSNGGPHFLFGKDKGLEYIKSLVKVKEYERKAGVYYNHIFPYPLQSNFNYPPDLPNDNSFKHSIRTKFGDDLSGMFFFPFNEKYSANMYDEVLPQDEYKTPNRSSAGWVSTFCDPVNGLSDLVEKMSMKCKISFNKEATFVDVVNKAVWFDKWPVFYDRLISTIPLNKLMELCGQKVNLPYTSVLVINIGGEPGINFPKEHWLYIPFCKSGFHRVSFYTNVDPSKAPEGKIGLSVETAFHNKELKDLNVPEIGAEIAKELASWGWIRSVDVCSADFISCAYTWQYDQESRENALQWLKERDIISTGRYGNWKFQGITQSIEDGFNV